MLELKQITKTYETKNFKQKALNEVSINFRKNEFASILGPSGSGKTTLLNIIGGLDHYDTGNLIINGISTKEYKDRDWDTYRNHKVGFVFQSYNLIPHQTVLANVELALTLSGVSKSERRIRAKKALTEVGLEKHINKKPSELSGGQMQRVAIARSLVNDPDILLADEPTGALDSETSKQVMEILKKIANKKLVIMVTHNPELAAEYSTRIIKLKDGCIISDSNPYDSKEKKKIEKVFNDKKTNMSFKTALSLSFNNLMTKKGRTILVAFAGSIGIIGIALILALSTGFQNYVDQIQEDTLTSYPLTIYQKSTDITGALLAMTNGSSNNQKGKVKEEQYLSSMLASISTNDLKSFKKYLDDNYNEVNKDISAIKYSYSIDPLIYTVDASGKLAKLNPSNLFNSFSGSSMLNSYSSFASIFSQMIDNQEILNEQYDVLAGKWPSKYDEMVIVLSDADSISDLLVYSLGLRNTDELTNIVTKIMSGEKVDINNEPLSFTYEELMNVKLKLIKPSETYKYNSKYKIYEDMSKDDEFMKKLYNSSETLKIVGVVTAKEGVNSMALSPGVAYTSDLIDYIIDSASKTDIVKEQLKNEKVDIFSGSRFDSKTNKFNLNIKDLISIDNKKLESAFNIKINQKELEANNANYMNEISNAITTDINPAKDAFTKNFNSLANGLFNSINGTISLSDVQNAVSSYLETDDATKILSNLEKDYVLPKETFKTTYNGLLPGLLSIYINSYYTTDPSLTTNIENPTAIVYQDITPKVIESYTSSAIFITTSETMAKYMTEGLMKKTILTKVGELTSNLTKSLASSFNIDEQKMASAFNLKLNEDELTRIITAMTTNTETNAKTNLASLGYQDKEEPTYISFYFNSFDGKEHFLDFINSYNNKVEEDKVINYSDTTGILMSSVKTIVNAVSYVLIAFVSVSLIVSSIMIGIITYISVYERTKEIGILRAIGASKKNISSIFNAETFIIGLLSGLFGITITYILVPIINLIIHHFTGSIPLNAVLNISSAITLVILSIILTLIGGLIPARKASTKDPVESLRNE